MLVSGSGCGDAAVEAAQIDGPARGRRMSKPAAAGVSRVLVAEDAALANNLAENVSKLLEGIQQKEWPCPLVPAPSPERRSFSHVLGSTSSVAKGALPRLAAVLDVAAITEGPPQARASDPPG